MAARGVARTPSSLLLPLQLQQLNGGRPLFRPNSLGRAPSLSHPGVGGLSPSTVRAMAPTLTPAGQFGGVGAPDADSDPTLGVGVAPQPADVYTATGDAVDGSTGMGQNAPPAPPELVTPQLLAAPREGLATRAGVALSNTPGYTPHPYESGGSAFFRGLLSGGAQGFSGAAVGDYQNKAAAVAATNKARQDAADIANLRSQKTWETRLGVWKDAQGKWAITADMAKKYPFLAPYVGLPAVAPKEIMDAAAKYDDAQAKKPTVEPGDANLIHGAVSAGIITPAAGQSLMAGMTREERREVMLKSVPGHADHTGGGTTISSGAQKIVDAISSGKMRPDIIKSLNYRGGLRDEVAVGLATKGIDINTMQFDISAENKFWSTQNDSKRTSMRTLLNTLEHSIPYTRSLVKRVKAEIPDLAIHGLNAGALVAAANTKGKAGKDAQLLLAQISDISGEVGGLYMGGNSNTDESFRVARQNLSSDWNEEQLMGGLDQIEYNAGVRKAAMLDVKPYTRTSTGDGTREPGETRPPIHSFWR